MIKVLEIEFYTVNRAYLAKNWGEGIGIGARLLNFEFYEGVAATVSRDTGEKQGWKRRVECVQAQNRGSSHANPQNQPLPTSLVVAVLRRLKTVIN